MFSTTLTTLDASPRAMSRSLKLLWNIKEKNSYNIILISLVIGTQFIILYAGSSMTILIKVATILSFISAPFYAICNLLLVRGENISESHRPPKALIVLSYLGILFMIGFSLYYLYYLIQ
jgi:Mn2+/Fe2+ NRAMP family transporter